VLVSTVDDQFVGGGGEPVDRGRQRRISDHGWQLVEAAVGGQHGGGVARAPTYLESRGVPSTFTGDTAEQIAPELAEVEWE